MPAGKGGAAIVWDKSPYVFVPGIEKYKDQLLNALRDLLMQYGPQFQAYAQANARWTDRTGNARQGIDYATEVDGRIVSLILFHRMSYGIWLELANDGRFAIIMDTIDFLGPDLIKAAQELFS